MWKKKAPFLKIWYYTVVNPVAGNIVTHSTVHLRQIGSPSTTDIHSLNPISGTHGKKLPWSAIVNVVLVEGRDLKAMDLEGTSDPYCKVR